MEITKMMNPICKCQSCDKEHLKLNIPNGQPFGQCDKCKGTLASIGVTHCPQYIVYIIQEQFIFIEK